MEYMFEKFVFYQYNNEIKENNENTHNLSTWDVSKVINMTGMFKNISVRNLETKNLKIKNWDVRNVLFMNHMFDNTVYSEDLSKWKPEKILYEPKNFGPDSITRPKWGARFVDKNDIRFILKEWLINKDLFKLQLRS